MDLDNIHLNNQIQLDLTRFLLPYLASPWLILRALVDNRAISAQRRPIQGGILEANPMANELRFFSAKKTKENVI